MRKSLLPEDGRCSGGFEEDSGEATTLVWTCVEDREELRCKDIGAAGGCQETRRNVEQDVEELHR